MAKTYEIRDPMHKENHLQLPLQDQESEQSAQKQIVQCLGMTFADDQERRNYFLGKLRTALQELREKLEGVPFSSIQDTIKRLESLQNWPFGHDSQAQELARKMAEAAGKKHQDNPGEGHDLLQLFKDEIGFPHGQKEDILALSDPPYYTSCPNPFIPEIIKQYGKPYDPETDTYHREPFATDTGSGKKHPIYTSHPYHSKIPHLATMPCILHYTEPGDIVFDGFAGSGMTGVAAQLCGEPESNFKAKLEQDWKNAGLKSPKWGARRPILIDLSPVANFIAYNLNLDVSAREFKKAADSFFKKIDAELGWMYETLHTDGRRKGRINYVVWSEVFTCPNCAGDVVFMDQAYDPKTGKFAKEFLCPHCEANLTTRNCEHKFTTKLDKAIGETVRKVTYVPVEIEYILPGDKTKYHKKPDAADLENINSLTNEQPKDWFPTTKLPIGRMRDSNHLAERGITHYHQFYLPRALHALSIMWRVAGECADARMNGFLKFLVESSFWTKSLVNRYRPTGYSMTNQFITGMFYIPVAVSEISPWYILDGKSKRLQKMLAAQQLPTSRQGIISTASSLHSPIPDKSVDYIYTDPPFGEAIKYGDLNLLIEAWHNLFSRLEDEVLWDKLKNKSLSVYSELMRRAFAENYRILKPGRWMTVVFHNSKNLVWTAIQEATGNAGFVVADVRTLDREQGSFNQVTAAGAVKQDLVISAYKPNVGLEKRFQLQAGTEEGVWEFVRNHLKQLPVFATQGEAAEAVAERQNYLLFDRMIAFHVQRGVSVPMSAAEFYQGLAQRFDERDGMYFLPEQAAEYDKKRRTVKQFRQLTLMVIDEASAIQWLKQQLFRKPQTFQELHPQFMKEIGGWQKHEKMLELSDLLEQNFLIYNEGSPIPAQIVSWMKQSEELREIIAQEIEAGRLREDQGALHIEHTSLQISRLTSRARSRWYVPNPYRAADLEKLREKSLLKEFEEYQQFKGRKMKQFRLEAVRAGFKKAWQERDYQTIINIAEKIPEKVLQEDQKLLMWYDQAVTRVGD